MAKRKTRKRMDLPTLVAEFYDETKCHAYLEGLRWHDGVACPGRLIDVKTKTRAKCGSTKILRLAKRHLFECVDCGYQFSTRVGTIFEDSKLPLWKWFVAVFMMAESKKGVSAKQIERMLAISYKTAWYLCHRIRKAMEVKNEEPLRGIVEIDETYVGGKRRGVGPGYVDNKAVVIAAIQRGGQMRARVLPNRRKESVRKFVAENVHDDAEAIFTDEAPVYDGLAGPNTRHESVKHNVHYTHDGKIKREWVRGQVHTNTVEGVHSLLKRSIIGAFHHISVKHLPAYVDEIEWRHNNRNNPFLFRDTILELIGAE